MDIETWGAIEQERLSLADLLAGLSADQWEAQSLCTEWRVRDVAAHLVMTPAAEPSVATMVKALARNRGHLWNAGRDVAIAYAARPTERIVADLRRDAASRTKPVFVDPANILLDLVVHGQDIAVPLGLIREVPPLTGAAALDRIWSMGWPFHAKRRLSGLSLATVDGTWRAGEGPEVVGTAADLLLLATRRDDVALQRLQGPGLGQLSRAGRG
ncbi:MAG TPA: maleylpyruvate isomerase family mycothiol-dependent enzyme [Propionibacteriaceae bacterium]